MSAEKDQAADQACKRKNVAYDSFLPKKSKCCSSTKGTEMDIKNGKAEKEEFVLFYGHYSPFSQHHPCTFVIDGQTYNCAEQYYMQQKAVIFRDGEFERKILASTDPKEQKRLGRKVRNFDIEVWKKHCIGVVERGNEAKFSQNPDLKVKLLDTYPKLLVEASPRDRIWGIGLGAKNPKALNKETWRGKNQLGYAITRVREELMRLETAESGHAGDLEIAEGGATRILKTDDVIRHTQEPKIADGSHARKLETDEVVTTRELEIVDGGHARKLETDEVVTTKELGTVDGGHTEELETPEVGHAGELESTKAGNTRELGEAEAGNAGESEAAETGSAKEAKKTKAGHAEELESAEAGNNGELKEAETGNAGESEAAETGSARESKTTEAGHAEEPKTT